jgi:hypothetical protein
MALLVAAPGVLGNDFDSEGDVLTASRVMGPGQGPFHGSLVFSADGSFRYTPAPGFHGSDLFAYTVREVAGPPGQSGPVPVPVRILVAPVNDPPVAGANEYRAFEDLPLEVPAASGVLSNDADPDADDLTALLVTGPAHGGLTLNADGSFRYTPSPDFNGTDQFTYAAFDAGGGTAAGAVVLVVREVNDPPLALPESATTLESVPVGIVVLANDRPGPANESGQALTVIGALAHHGTVGIRGNGALLYTPRADYNGPDTITYTIQDNGTTAGAGSARVGMGTVSLFVIPVPTPGERLVSDLYPDLLRRPVDPSGMGHWGSQIDQGVPLGLVAWAITQSTEYRTLVVQDLYGRYLRRSAEPVGLVHFVSFLGAGGTVDQARAIILGSPEYLQARTDGTATGFLEAIYQDVLGRAPDSAGREAWRGLLAAGASPGAVAQGITTSLESQTRRVQGWYSQFLGRPAEEAGLRFWVGQLAGPHSEERVLAAIAGSEEYFALSGLAPRFPDGL